MWNAETPSDGDVSRDHQLSTPLPAAFGVAVVVMVATIVGSLAFRTNETGTYVMLLVLVGLIGWVVRKLPMAVDRSWLPTYIVAGWVAKLLASGGRYWALQVLYHGVGDASGYHGHGVRNAPVWRSFHIPQLGTGTHFVDAAASFLYIPYIPTKLGGFFMFATLAFFGQVLFYAAFRRAFPNSSLKLYAALIFFFPNIVYWPSSIGKEALMIPFISIAAYGAVRLFADYRPKWVMVLALGILGSGLIRSHIALLLILSVAGAMFMGKRPALKSARIRRLTSMVGIAAVLAGAAGYAIQDFGIDISSGISASLVEDELDPIFAGVEDQTGKGGSAVEGAGIRSPLDIPEAVLRVVFQPLPWDANSIQTLVSAIFEGSLLLGLFIWRTSSIIRHFRRRWRQPYALFSLIYTAGFVFGHSPVLNLGIMARQRSQMIPFVLVLLVALGDRTGTGSEIADPETVTVPALSRF